MFVALVQRDLSRSAGACTDYRRRRAVTEKDGRDHVGLLQAVGPEGQGTGFHRNHQHGAAGIGGGEPAGDGQARHAACAAQPEDRHAAQVAAKAHRAERLRLQRRGRDPGGGDGDDRIDLIRRDPGCRQRVPSCVDEQFRGPGHVGGPAVGPAVVFGIPVHRHHAVARVDARIFERRDELFEERVFRGQQAPGLIQDIGLAHGMGRDGGTDPLHDSHRAQARRRTVDGRQLLQHGTGLSGNVARTDGQRRKFPAPVWGERAFPPVPGWRLTL